KKQGDSDLLELLTDADDDEPGNKNTDSGSALILKKLHTDEEVEFKNVLEYLFDKKGNHLLIEQAKDPGDSTAKAAIVLFHLSDLTTDTILYGGNDFKNFEFSEDGSLLAFIAERDANPKDLVKLYKLWYYKTGQDSAALLVD